jgi:hypothetical protein
VAVVVLVVADYPVGLAELQAVVTTADTQGLKAVI